MTQECRVHEMPLGLLLWTPDWRGGLCLAALDSSPVGMDTLSAKVYEQK